MIWIAAVAVLVLAAGTLFLARTMQARAVVAAAGAAAIAAYFLLGKPNMPDEPLSARVDALEKQAETAAESLTPEQMMAIIEKRAKQSPNDPEPHKYMGDILAMTGRPEQAIMAYQSSLRRDPGYRPAIKSLADLLFRLSGHVEPATADLYREAFKLDPTDLRVGYMAGLGDWEAGKRAEAEALWASIDTQVPAGSPYAEMFKALRQMAQEIAPAPPADGSPALPIPPANSPKAPS